MMMNVGFFSYVVAAGAFSLLTLILLTSWRGRLQGWLLVSASGLTAAWAVVAAWHAAVGYPATPLVPLIEALRDAVWFAFLFRLFNPVAPQSPASQENGAAQPRVGWWGIVVRLRMFAVILGGTASALVGLLLYTWLFGATSIALGVEAPIGAFVVLAVGGLGLVEQLYRNTRPEQRWAIKFLCLGIGGLFAYDFYLYSNALLFKHVDVDLWAARGFITALAAPLLAVSAARNPQWSLDVFVSRDVVFHSAALLGAGIYLLVMAAGGYYIRLYGGSWGVVAQAIFLFGAVLILLMIMVSGQLRARAKVFFNKHFFNRRYDYREEWLRFTRTLSKDRDPSRVREHALQALADIVDSPSGVLWWRRENGYVPVAWSMPPPVGVVERAEGALVTFLRGRNWIINLDELARNSRAYADLEIPAWLSELPRAWLVVPLVLHDDMPGFIVLTQARAERSLNWEDRDLLKTAGSQTASFVAQFEATQALAEARQFEAFNRLSAFVMHDLKNLVAQLSLVVSNAARHQHNPAFMEDAIRTVEHSVGKMNRLLAQLRAGSGKNPRLPGRVELDSVLRDVVAAATQLKPAPLLERSEAGTCVLADKDRLAAVFAHLIQNAQEATPPEGRVRVRLYREDGLAVIEVEDSGRGMDAEFIRDRLFRPFQTTKGPAGMGIGVYQSRELVRELQGDINVTSQVGQGTLFRIYLPLYAAGAR